MKKSDKERLKKIVSTWENLSRQMQQHGITPELLLEDEFAQWAVTTPLYNIGEQVYQLSSEFKAAYPDQPWNMVAGLRHRLVHDYDGINWTIIVEVVFSDLDPFVDAVREILAGMLEAPPTKRHSFAALKNKVLHRFLVLFFVL